nr:hypothetical protein CFP56_58035 [Quercus suber]
MEVEEEICGVGFAKGLRKTNRSEGRLRLNGTTTVAFDSSDVEAERPCKGGEGSGSLELNDGTKEEPTGTREIFDLWFPASAVDEKDLNRFSGYAQTVIKRYNKVKKTDFEFVRLVKMRWTLGHFYLRFKAKAKSSGAATLKTFEGDVRCNWCLVNEEDGRPLSCRLIGRKFDDYFSLINSCPILVYMGRKSLKILLTKLI